MKQFIMLKDLLTLFLKMIKVLHVDINLKNKVIQKQDELLNKTFLNQSNFHQLNILLLTINEKLKT